MADSTYVYDGEPFEVPERIVRPTAQDIFEDDVVNNLYDSMTDSLHAAWNGWNAAVTMKSRPLEDHYMRLIQFIVQSRDKLAKISKLKNKF